MKKLYSNIIELEHFLNRYKAPINFFSILKGDFPFLFSIGMSIKRHDEKIFSHTSNERGNNNEPTKRTKKKKS